MAQESVPPLLAALHNPHAPAIPPPTTITLGDPTPGAPEPESPQKERERKDVKDIFYDKGQTVCIETEDRLAGLEETVQQTIMPKAGYAAQVISGLINGVVIYAFCNVFASILFTGDTLKSQVAIGVGMNCVSAFLAGILTSTFSGCKIFISGPDINPTIIQLSIVQAILAKLECVTDEGEKYKTLAAEAAADVGDYALDSAASPDCAPDSILPTVLFASLLTTFLIAVIWLLMGKFKVTRIVQFIPASVLRGFLACIGYKIMKTAIEQATGIKLKKWKYAKEVFLGWERGWMLLLPALPIGIPLYFLKKFHIGNPAVIFPAFIILPLVVFYIVLFASGNTIAIARDKSWFFPTVKQGLFWKQWQEMKWSKIDGAALIPAIPDYLVLLVIASLDYMLKLAGSEKALAVDVEFDKEFKLQGMNNLLITLFMGTPGYSQAKFNVLNYSIIRNTNQRLPGYVCAAFNGIFWLAGYPLLNYIPRFLLAGLLIFAGMGFVVENLWDARLGLSWLEFATVYIIVIINAVFGLLPAVGIGIIIATVIFMLQYASHTPVKARMTSADAKTQVLRKPEEEKKIVQLGSSMCRILILQGFIFFGSASRVLDNVQDMIKKKTSGVLGWATLRYIVLDFNNVLGVDVSSLTAFGKAKRLAGKVGVMLLWCGLKPMAKKLIQKEGVASECAMFTDLEETVEWVEEQLLEWSRVMRKKWLACDALLFYNALERIRLTASTFRNLFERGTININQLLKYCDRKLVAPNQTLCHEGDPHHTLYYVHRGTLNATANIAGREETLTLMVGTYANGDAFWLGVPATHTLKTSSHCSLLLLTRDKMEEMEVDAPKTAFALTRSVLKTAFDAKSKKGWQDEDDIEQNSVVHSKGHPQAHTHFMTAIKTALTGGSFAGCDTTHGRIPSLSPVEVQQFTEIWESYEQDLTGTFSTSDISELGTAINILHNYTHHRPNPWEKNPATAQVSGTHTLESFLEVVKGTVLCPISPEFEDRLKTVFDQFDEDKSGTICFKELGKLMASSGTQLDDLSLQCLMNEIDTDGTGGIDFEEFVCMISRFIRRSKWQAEYEDTFKRFVAAETPLYKLLWKYRVSDLKNVYNLLTSLPLGLSPYELQHLANLTPPDVPKGVSIKLGIQKIKELSALAKNELETDWSTIQIPRGNVEENTVDIITPTSLKWAMHALGTEITESEAMDMITEADEGFNGDLGFQEWLTAVLNTATQC